MYEGVDTVILFDELAYQATTPVHWRLLEKPLSFEEQGRLNESNLRMLQSYSAIEEYGQQERQADEAAYAADFARLELKVNLLLDLMGRILNANEPRPPAMHIRFNALGAIVQFTPHAVQLGDEGLLEIYLKECLVDPLRMVGRVANIAADGAAKIKFSPPGESVGNLIEKLAFLRHRRHVAESKQQRPFDPLRTGKFRR